MYYEGLKFWTSLFLQLLPCSSPGTLSCRHRVLSPLDNQWGGVHPNGTVTGLIGLVARREAHIAICEITITSKCHFPRVYTR